MLSSHEIPNLEKVIHRPTIQLTVGMIAAGIAHVLDSTSTEAFHRSLDIIKYLLVGMTLPIELVQGQDSAGVCHTVITYLKSRNLDTRFIGGIENHILDLVGSLVLHLRSNPHILWVDEPDPLWAETLQNGNLNRIDYDSQCQVKMWQSKPAVRWKFPLPEEYCLDPSNSNNALKLVETCLIMLEELIHLTQLSTDGLYISSLEVSFKFTNEEAIDRLIERLAETDPCIILRRLIGEKVCQTQWYRARAEKARTDKHYPLDFGNFWAMACLILQLSQDDIRDGELPLSQNLTVTLLSELHEWFHKSPYLAMEFIQYDLAPRIFNPMIEELPNSPELRSLMLKPKSAIHLYLMHWASRLESLEISTDPDDQENYMRVYDHLLKFISGLMLEKDQQLVAPKVLKTANFPELIATLKDQAREILPQSA
jgi:hypothetical protein